MLIKYKYAILFYIMLEFLLTEPTSTHNETAEIEAHCKFYYNSDSTECGQPVCGRNLKNHSLAMFENNCTYNGYVCLYRTLHEEVMFIKCDLHKDVPYVKKLFWMDVPGANPSEEPKKPLREDPGWRGKVLKGFSNLLQGLELDLKINV